MTSGIASKGVDLDSIFDSYQAGTTKARAAGLNVAGSDTSNRYANIIYGSAAAATGIQSEGADLNTLYAAKGTAKYPTPDNGVTYDSRVNIPSGQTGAATINMTIGGGQYIVTVYTRGLAGSGTSTQYPFAIPSGVTQFKAVLTFATGTTSLVSTTDVTTWTNIPASLQELVTLQSGPRGSQSGTVDSNWTCALSFGNGGTALYSGSSNWDTETDGSA